MYTPVNYFGHLYHIPQIGIQVPQRQGLPIRYPTHYQVPRTINRQDTCIKPHGIFKDIPIQDAICQFRVEQETINLQAFLFIVKKLIASYNIYTSDQSICDVFHFFDKDGNGFLDRLELLSGLLLLCKGTEREKLRSVFEIFDTNQDNFISMDELFKFLHSVFKVIFTEESKHKYLAQGIRIDSAECLASHTALDCFRKYDINCDGKLSFEEFCRWFRTISISHTSNQIQRIF